MALNSLPTSRIMWRNGKEKDEREDVRIKLFAKWFCDCRNLGFCFVFVQSKLDNLKTRFTEELNFLRGV